MPWTLVASNEVAGRRDLEFYGFGSWMTGAAQKAQRNGRAPRKQQDPAPPAPRAAGPATPPSPRAARGSAAATQVLRWRALPGLFEQLSMLLPF